MKVRASPKTGRTVVELGRRETDFPAVALAEIQLKRILVPVDFSECSSKALQYAISFAKQFNAEITLLHVITPPVYSVYADGTGLAVTTMMFDDTSLREVAAKQLCEWRNRIASGATVKANVRSGVSYYEIVNAAEETNTDLIIIGTHGRSGLARMFIGSTAERVVRHAGCPVMVIREREHDFVQADEAATKTKRFRTDPRRTEPRSRTRAR